MNPILLKSAIGHEISPFATALARLRIAVFKEWPYLYQGSMDDERNYLEKYVACAESVVALAQDGDEVVGASTGIPLVQADPDFQNAFAGSEYSIDSIFYFGESVLLPEYRGIGLGKRFFDIREAHARRYGARYAAFCAVDREPDDPRKPAAYRQLDGFWQSRGYRKHPEIKAIFDWREIGEAVKSAHSLSFWIKALEPASS